MSYQQKGIDGAEVLRPCKSARIVDVAKQLGINTSTVQYYLKKARRGREA